MYIVIVFKLKWLFGAHVWRRGPPCARHCNKEYLLNSPLTIESLTPAFHSIKAVSATSEFQGLIGVFSCIVIACYFIQIPRTFMCFSTLLEAYKETAFVYELNVDCYGRYGEEKLMHTVFIY